MPRSIEPGTVVKVNTGELAVRRGSPAILLSMNSAGSVRLLTDAGTTLVVRNEITVPRMPMPSYVPMRLRLAYGVWTEEDGSKVLFSRDYCPMWRLSPNGRTSPEEPWRWITFVNQEWFWDDARTPWRDHQLEQKIEERMERLGVTGVPKLVNVINALVNGEADDIRKAVRLMAPPGEPIHAHY